MEEVVPEPPMERLSQNADERASSRGFAFSEAFAELVIQQEEGHASMQSGAGLIA